MVFDRSWLALLVTILVAVGSSAVAGVAALRDLDTVMRTVVEQDTRRLLAVTGVRRFYRMTAMAEQELGHAETEQERERLRAVLAELREQRAAKLAEYAGLMPAEDAAAHAALVERHQASRALSDRMEDWEATIGELVEVNHERLQRRAAESVTVGRTAATMIMVVSGLAAAFALLLGAAITRRRRRDAEALAESEQRLRRVVQSAPSVLAIVWPDLRLRFVSPNCERITGFTAAQLVTEPFCWIHPDERPRVEQALRGGLEGVAVDLELRAVRPDGAPWHAAVSLSPMRSAEGAIEGVLGQILDVSARHLAEVERARLEEQLRHAQRMDSIGRLAGGVAHDFNNLLTAIGGSASLAQLELPESHPAREMVDVIAEASTRAAKLTRQLLAFSRKQVLSPKNVDLNQVLADMHKMLDRIIGEDVHLEFHAAAELGVARVDPGQCEQIVVNLVVNARDAMPNGGRVVVETGNATFEVSAPGPTEQRPAGQFVMLAVSDTGIGMSAEVMSHLFEPFFSTKGPGRGTGLGLSMVYGAVKQQGGFVQVYSEEGKGSTFRIYLPRVHQAADAVASVAPTRALPTGTETILLVEDDPTVRKFAREALASFGYAVVEAGSAEDALRLVTGQQRVDLLLTDVVLPGRGGLELAAELQAKRPGLRVLFASGYSDRILGGAAAPSEPIDLLTKPYDAAALARRVRGALDRPQASCSGLPAA